MCLGLCRPSSPTEAGRQHVAQKKQEDNSLGSKPEDKTGLQAENKGAETQEEKHYRLCDKNHLIDNSDLSRYLYFLDKKTKTQRSQKKFIQLLEVGKHVECDAVFQCRKSLFCIKKEAQIFTRLDEYNQIKKKPESDVLRPKLKLHLKYSLY
ncbi:Cat Eye Syndrome Critical Region Protein 2 [Manis pentadactyla]|nr:Cat Eye Syndrome Critical Region Protein 2 [Manis pentadactyla]